MEGPMITAKPLFSRDQIVSASDLQRRWKERVEPKLSEYPFVLLLSGTEPRAAVMDYSRFEQLWANAQQGAELRLQVEVLTRLVKQLQSGAEYIPLAELVAESGLKPEDYAGDVDVECEPK